MSNSNQVPYKTLKKLIKEANKHQTEEFRKEIKKEVNNHLEPHAVQMASLGDKIPDPLSKREKVVNYLADVFKKALIGVVIILVLKLSVNTFGADDDIARFVITLLTL